MGEGPVERFRPTSGGISGWLGLTLAAFVVVLGVVNRAAGFPLPVVAGALVLGVLVWAALLRPQVSATGDDLVLRNMLGTSTIPLAAIEEVAVRQVLAVNAGRRRYVSPAVGKPRRKVGNEWTRGATVDPPTRRGADRTLNDVPYADFVADRISHLASDARARQGVRLGSPEQQRLADGVRSSRAWPEIVALGATTAFLVVSILL